MRRIWADILSHEAFGSTDAFSAVGGKEEDIPELERRIREHFGYDLPLGRDGADITLHSLVMLLRGNAAGDAATSLVTLRPQGLGIIRLAGRRTLMSDLEAVVRVLKEHPAVRDTAVMNALADSGEALVVIAPRDFLTGVEARRIAEAPSVAFVLVPDLWRDAAGRLDEARCREYVQEPGAVYRYEAPRNEAEERLVAIWQDLLGVPDVGVLDDFIESGGDSLSALRLIDAVHDAFGVEMMLVDLLDYANIRELAGEISSRHEVTHG
ncbi:phosphopantetheine-binding protein [Nonomuraea africana]|uniref:Acyl carrier protein n=1 Tax=Nonomuraea africana TaxID=46171 RepID=A0ABR9KPH3_9ACTN|nr:phosphopantetheine-binding protein [Nonomuraea africana]MBE1563670.1 acyl carrier protein [Nonomuraea africana]